MTTPYVLLIASVACFALPWGAARLGVSTALANHWTVVNYRGHSVPLGLGWALVAWAVPVAVLVDTRLALLAVAAALLGLVDDRWGGAGAKGFRGHLRQAASGRFSTGLLKMVGIGVVSLLAAWPLHRSGPAPRLVTWLLSAAVIALSANLVNLLDLRPGRALKAYTLIMAPLYVAALVAGEPWRRGDPFVWLLFLVPGIVIFGPVAAVWPLDLGERAMLGDMGANAFGAIAGWYLVAALPFAGLVAAAGLLLVLNLASERVSFSRVIQRNRFLSWLDTLGRSGADDGRE